jgi:hypothetical protein
VITAYFDDSGTHQGSPVVAVGGLIGSEDQWAEFDERWKKLLAEPLPGKPSLKQFHSTECRGNHGPFGNYNVAERDRITYLFRQIILETGLFSVASIIDQIAWNELVVGPIRMIIGEADVFCSSKCIDCAIRIARLAYPGQKLAVVFDRGFQSDMLTRVAGLYEKRKDDYPEVSAIGFAKVADMCGLQGADMIATESYWYAQEWLKAGADAKARAHFRDYLTRDLSAGLIADREAIEGVVKTFGGLLKAGDPDLTALAVRISQEERSS